MTIRNINPELGDPVEFDSVEEMVAAVESLGYMPEDGLKEGRDYIEVITRERIADDIFHYAAGEMERPEYADSIADDWAIAAREVRITLDAPTDIESGNDGTEQLDAAIDSAATDILNALEHING